LVAFVLVFAGCSSGGGGDSEAGSADDAGVEAANGDAPAESPQRDALSDSDERSPADFNGLNTAFEAQSRPDDGSTARKIIAKGNVSLHSGDVAQTAFDVTELADQHAGEVTERETTTNKDGDVSTARLLLRIPVADFGAVFEELQEVADLTSADSGQEDVTTKVIDTQVRIRAQRRSLARVEALLDRAQSISDIIRIEGQLTRRQADLESLEGRLAYLRNQTSMSTISVNIALTPEKKEKQKEEKKEREEAGFIAGLSDGWDAFKDFGTDITTLAGKLLPFAGALVLIGGPLWLLVRRFRRRDDDSPVATADAGAGA
jgi:hypothetical protein